MADNRPYVLARAFKPSEAFGKPKGYMNGLETDKDGLIVDDQRVKLGVVYGRASRVVIRNRENPDGSVSTWFGLGGAFEAVPEREELPVTKAPVAWIIEHIYEMIAPNLKDQGKGVEPNAEGAESVDFAFDVYIVTSQKIAAGFRWEYVPLFDGGAAVADPLSELRALATAKSAPALAAPEKKGKK